jgi:phosphoribosyl-dephospho-CoA transferase
MFARHDVVWLTKEGWDDVIRQAEPELHPALERWRIADGPAVVRCADEETEMGQLCVGVVLPPHVDESRQRIGVRVPIESVRESRRPMPLEDVVEAAPAPWQPALRALAGEAAERQLSFRVYGSLALQVLTGERYLSARSDIDILFLPASITELGRGTGLLSYFSGLVPLDGEIVFPGCKAVSWKEWVQAMHARGNPRVLAKSRHATGHFPVESLLSSFD